LGTSCAVMWNTRMDAWQTCFVLLLEATIKVISHYSIRFRKLLHLPSFTIIYDHLLISLNNSY
jgi:hypothetical protein